MTRPPTRSTPFPYTTLFRSRGSETRQALLDFGFTPTALFNNLDLLKIDRASIDALIVSHGHFDHFGGLVSLLKRDRDRKSTRLNSSHLGISYAVFCLKKKSE